MPSDRIRPALFEVDPVLPSRGLRLNNSVLRTDRRRAFRVERSGGVIEYRWLGTSSQSKMTDRRVLSPGAAADGPMREKMEQMADYSEWSEDRLQRRLADVIESSKVRHSDKRQREIDKEIAQLVFELQFRNGHGGPERSR
jgi:hypothetical protein